MNVPTGFALACEHCGQIPPADLEMGAVQTHFIIEHGTTEVHLELCWVGQPQPCPDPRWVQCQIDHACYRGGKGPGEPHDGDCWVPS
jgi:hypothetical protein